MGAVVPGTSETTLTLWRSNSSCKTKNRRVSPFMSNHNSNNRRSTYQPSSNFSRLYQNKSTTVLLVFNSITISINIFCRKGSDFQPPQALLNSTIYSRVSSSAVEEAHRGVQSLTSQSSRPMTPKLNWINMLVKAIISNNEETIRRISVTPII